MERKSLREVYEEIEVPKDEVLDAIRTGKERASQDIHKNKIVPIKFVWSTVAAAAIIVSSSFISPSLSHVMAEVPLLGNVYTAFNDAVGRSLQSQDLITELNKTSSYKGVDVTITNAYYDGAVVGVTFSVNGDVRTDEDGRIQGFYKIFDGKDNISDSKEVVYMEPSDNGYIGHIQLSYPKTELPPETSFPLEFKRIGEKEGSWSFDVPINQLPYETVNVDKGTKNEDAEINVHFDSVIEGKASTAINYSATFPIEGKYDQVRLEAYDDQGREIHISTDGMDLGTIEENNKVIVNGRSIIPESLNGKTSYIEVLPKVVLSEPDYFVKLDDATPVEINAARQDLAVEIENITVQDKSVTFDFQINNGNKMNQDFLFLSEFARNNFILVKESEKDIYKESIKHSIEVINKDNLRFSSTFDISKINDFNLKDYVIRINIGTLSSNTPVEFEKVKIDLN
ncbi:DUF4179 domain-containing protein [Oceanobacillus chungangensis]|uniref:DUF4179 domain-containing protein n=1 Tax=Oceanobacillus chungangensis TaxID=1229152 RepID=A0A3D8PMV6_9BACI|nr:DUF4179 domain-containing protein [Oceanobacillus chungangensis]RDW17433.1 DUF4179 domain-containing protein [Oceanobacillus chungangensis]